MNLRAAAALLGIVLLWGCESSLVEEPGGALELIPAELEFGSVPLGQSKTLRLLVRNRTDSAVVLAPSITGADRAAFSIVAQPAGTLPAGRTDSLLLRFTPTEERRYTATLLIGEPAVRVPLSGTGVPPGGIGAGELLAVEVSTAPRLDGRADDLAWQSAPPLLLTLRQVEPLAQDNRTFRLTLRAAVYRDTLYLLAEIEDPTPHETPNWFRFTGGDAASEANWQLTTQGQDGLALMFPIGEVYGDRPGERFETVGCLTACHPTASLNAYEGGSYPTRGRLDIWYWKAGTTGPQGYADDYIAEGSDGQRFPNERRGDIGNAFEDPNFPPRGSGPMLPISMAGGDNGGLDRTRFLWQPTAVAFNPRAPNPATGRPWSAGDGVPGWALRAQTNPFSSRGDIRARALHSNGRWTVELKRALNTGNSDDVVLYRGRSIPFSVAYFDNVRKYALFEYLNLPSAPRPGHFGPDPPVLWLRLP
jgi:hypothetical protein